VIPLVGLALAGRSVTEHAGAGSVGRPVWGASALLGDLELRLGLPHHEAAGSVRVQAWLRALEKHATAFYERSLRVDALGTARVLLGWRDELVLAGWNGEVISGGGARLEALACVQQLAELPPGRADRIRRVEQTLAAEAAGRLYDELRLAEPLEAWPERWRSIFDQLAGAGTLISVLPSRSIPIARAGTDLARVQAALCAGRPDPAGAALRGDGTFVVLRGETSWQLADCAAALLARADPRAVLVMRGGDARALDLALSTHGLATQGVAEASEWRGALQLLPLAVLLLYSPRDVHRTLDLVTLAKGPFDNLMGRALADALGEAPGVGGRAWSQARADAAERLREAALQRALDAGAPPKQVARRAESEASEMLDRVAAWLEAPVHDPVAGAPTQSLLEAVERVRALLKGRLAMEARAEGSVHADVLRAACIHANVLKGALERDSRDLISREAALQLVRDAGEGGAAVSITLELASRIEIADCPAAVRRAHERVLWWHAVAGTEWTPEPRPWRAAEVDALEAAGVVLTDPRARLAIEAEGWRAPVLGASEQLVLCVPRSLAEGSAEPHPILTEILALLGADDRALARITVTPGQLCGTERPTAAADSLGARSEAPAAWEPPPAELPPARSTWTIDAGLLGRTETLSATQIDALVGCPLRWVLDKRAGLKAGALASIPGDALLNGRLAHRVVEELHGLGVLGNRDATEREVPALLRQLVQEEAAPWLRPGKLFAWTETEREIKRSVVALADLIERSSLRVAAVETDFDATWEGRALEGRVDVLLEDGQGNEIVLDLKWGSSSYRVLLTRGLAIQLAVYAAARQLRSGSPRMPHAAYFGLFQGELLATEAGPYAGASTLAGPTIEETWARLGRSLELAEGLLARGIVPATGVWTLLDAAEVPGAERGGYLQLGAEHACKYCDFGSLCGRSWEALQ
jgi:ATP-dependent helicase/nuclease subunit B